MTDAKPVLVWLRRELRLDDNAALLAAEGRPVVLAFVLDDEAAGAWRAGGASRWWLHHSLAALGAAAERRGGRLVLRRGRYAQAIPALAAEIGASEVHAGVPVEPWARTALRQVQAALDVPLRVHVTTLLARPDAVRTQAGHGFSVYSAFARAFAARGELLPPAPAPERLAGPEAASERLEDWRLLPRAPDWAGGLRAEWTPGEAGARARLDGFVAGALDGYDARRDLPGVDGTSMLSPHLAFGEISPRRVWEAADGAKFRAELLWREFAAHLLWHHRDLPTVPMRAAFAAMPWRHEPAQLRAWQQGQTGVPIVDAGMRQLWRTGWMHNRVRMIVASYLVKHLLLPWQDGAAWFWDTLVDADLASNAASWQWVAGCGADAAPFFRIFNPVLQGRKFDPDGAYVRRFVPELAALPDSLIHAPWEAPAAVRRTLLYPPPLGDLAAGRARALAALATVTGRGVGRPGDAGLDS